MKKGLTIGELLIAMTIIGTIAVLILPGFIQDYHNNIYITSLKKVYEQIEVAIGQATMDSEVSYFRQTRYSLLGTNADGENIKDNQQAFLEKYFKTVNSDNNFCKEYLSINDIQNGTGAEPKCDGEFQPSATAKLATVTLTSGEALGLHCQPLSNNGDRNCYFYVDVNGKKEPNVGGKDMYTIPLLMSPTNKQERLGDFTFKGQHCKWSKHGDRCLEELMQAGWQMKYQYVNE